MIDERDRKRERRRANGADSERCSAAYQCSSPFPRWTSCLIVSFILFDRANKIPGRALHIRHRAAPLTVAAKISISSRVGWKAATASETLPSLCPDVWRLRNSDCAKLTSIWSKRQGQVGSRKGKVCQSGLRLHPPLFYRGSESLSSSWYHAISVIQ